jgi:hypothetical protein
VRQLSFSKANEWSTAIEVETDKDLSTIRLGVNNDVVPPDAAKRSARIVATCLVQTKMRCLNNHAFSEIQNWYDNDEQIVKHIRSILQLADPLPEFNYKGIYAAHVVAAAVVEALMGSTNLPVIFMRMLNILKTLHDRNPSWGPMYVTHPGDVVPIKAYISTLWMAHFSESNRQCITNLGKSEVYR